MLDISPLFRSPIHSKLMKHSFSILRSLTALVCIFGCVNAGFGAEASGVTAAEALQWLEQGNARFVAGRLSPTTPEGIAARREETAKGQKPFAIVVGCSDSR